MRPARARSFGRMSATPRSRRLSPTSRHASLHRARRSRSRSCGADRVAKERLHAKDRTAWTKWLELHHASATEVFLVFHRKSENVANVTYDEAVEEALCFGWIDGIKHKLDDARYTYRFTPRRDGSAWSDINKERIARLDAAGKIRPA